MFEKIHLSSLRNSEFSQFSNDVLGVIARNNPAALKVEKQEAGLRTLSKQADALFKTKKGFDTTEELIALDARRDKCITGISLNVHSLTYHFDEEVVQHAQILSKHLKHYGAGAIARENYVSETAHIKAVLKDWETKPELKAAIKKLQLEGWKTALETDNNAFNELYLERNAEMGAASTDTLREKRIEVGDAFYALCNHISAYHILKDGADPYGKTVKELNALIGQYNALLAGRKGKADEDVDESDTVLEETTEE